MFHSSRRMRYILVLLFALGVAIEASSIPKAQKKEAPKPDYSYKGPVQYAAGDKQEGKQFHSSGSKQATVDKGSFTRNKKAEPRCDSYPCMIFEDTFDTLDLDTWEHEITAGGGGNWEFQYYTNNRSNSYVKDGVLYLKPTFTEETYGPGFISSGNLELWGGSPANLCTGNQWYGCMRQGTDSNYINPIQSARVRTVNSFSTNGGRVEVSARLPKGDWIWPAIWMMPKHSFYGEWPASGEIDIMESRGNLDLKDGQGVSKGHDEIGATMHWGPFFTANKYALTNTNRHGDFGDNFHTYAVEWDETSVNFFLDGEEIMNVNPGDGGFWEFGGLNNELPADRNPWVHGGRMAPFDKEFYIIMNVAVGGTNGFFSDSWTNANGAKPWNNQSPQAPKEFWLARDAWEPTWNRGANNGEGAALAIESVRVYKMKA